MNDRIVEKKQPVVYEPMNLPWVLASYGGGEGVVEDCSGAKVMTNQWANQVCPDFQRMHNIVRTMNSHDQLVAALKDALATIDDYLAYEHNGDPWTEDARAMGEMDIDDYERDGRLERARAALAAAGEQS